MDRHRRERTIERRRRGANLSSYQFAAGSLRILIEVIYLDLRRVRRWLTIQFHWSER